MSSAGGDPSPAHGHRVAVVAVRTKRAEHRGVAGPRTGLVERQPGPRRGPARPMSPSRWSLPRAGDADSARPGVRRRSNGRIATKGGPGGPLRVSAGDAACRPDRPGSRPGSQSAADRHAERRRNRVTEQVGDGATARNPTSSSSSTAIAPSSRGFRGSARRPTQRVRAATGERRRQLADDDGGERGAGGGEQHVAGRSRVAGPPAARRRARRRRRPSTTAASVGPSTPNARRRSARSMRCAAHAAAASSGSGVGGSAPSASAGSRSVPMSRARICSTPRASGKRPPESAQTTNGVSSATLSVRW